MITKKTTYRRRGEYTCQTCAYFDPLPDGQGMCVRYPPKPGPYNEYTGEYFPAWPKLAVDNWCGEHRLASSMDHFEQITEDVAAIAGEPAP